MDLLKGIERLVTKDYNLRKQRAVEIIKQLKGFPQIDFESDEAEEQLLKFIDSIFPDTKSTKNSPIGDLWVDPKSYLEFKFKEDEKQKEDPEYKPTVRCAWIRNRGPYAGKVCYQEIPEGSHSYYGNIYDARCKDCKRNNQEKANKLNAEKFEEVLNGTEVKGSPTNFNSITINHLPGASVTGIDSGGATSPVSKEPVSKFLSGEETGDPSPSNAKKKKSSPRPKKLKLSVIKKLPEIQENHKYYRSSETQDGDTWIVSLNKETEAYVIIGKIHGQNDSPTDKDIRNLKELDEEDLKKAETFKLKYNYYSVKPEEPEEPEEPEDLLTTTSFEDGDDHLEEAGGKGSDYEEDTEDDGVEDMIRRLEEDN